MIGNIVRRVMHIIREERSNELKEIENDNIKISSGSPVTFKLQYLELLCAIDKN